MANISKILFDGVNLIAEPGCYIIKYNSKNSEIMTALILWSLVAVIAVSAVSIRTAKVVATYNRRHVTHVDDRFYK